MPLPDLGQGSTAPSVTPSQGCPASASIHAKLLQAPLMSAKEKGTPQLSKQVTLPQLPRELCGTTSRATGCCENYEPTSGSLQVAWQLKAESMSG